MEAPKPPVAGVTSKPGPWVDLALTLPVFLGYHAGVVFLDVKNASDVVTGVLMSAAEGNKGIYLLITAAIGVVFAGTFAWLGRGQAFKPRKLAQIALEGALYALLMRFGGAYLVGHMLAGKIVMSGFTGFIMSLGAGFYEEITYRVLLFGLGAKLLTMVFAKDKRSVLSIIVMLVWGLVCAAIFSSVHYIGPFADKLEAASFLFRMALGVFLTLIFSFRGFAAAVWAHALYDVWVLVL